jgi:DNA-directed RNA polymerase
MYIVGKIFDSLGIMFEGARNLQKWLNATARIIANSVPGELLSDVHRQDLEWVRQRGLLPEARQELLKQIEEEVDRSDLSAVGDLEEAALEEARDEEEKDETSNLPLKISSVVWTSPLGMPIVQPYWNYRARTVRTYLQTVTLFDPKSPCPVDSQKQSTAFPPNFIHSLDASHMMLSAIACKAAGLEFAAVHDSYWTHAADVDKMNSILREAFVKLHSENLMSRLRQELIQRYRHHKIPVDVKLRGSDVDAFIQHAKATKRRVILPRSKKDASPVKIIQVYAELEIPPLPSRGKFNVEQVKNSAYFFH